MSRKKPTGQVRPPQAPTPELQAFVEGRKPATTNGEAKAWAPDRQLPVRLPVPLFEKIQRECFERSLELGRRFSMAERIREILGQHYGEEK
jgi:hypothetical protein